MKIFLIGLVLFIALFGNFSVAEAQNIINGTAFEQDYGQNSINEEDFNFQSLPEDPGVEVAPLFQNEQDEKPTENKDVTTNIIIDDDG